MRDLLNLNLDFAQLISALYSAFAYWIKGSRRSAWDVFVAGSSHSWDLIRRIKRGMPPAQTRGFIRRHYFAGGG